MEFVPAVNDPVVLRAGLGRRHPSRVEGVRRGMLTVARPLDLPATELEEPGTELWVTWPDPRGVAVLPARLLEVHSEGDVQLWSLALTGPGWVEQRREFVRVGARGPLCLHRVPEEEGDVFGTMLDLSEAAIHCSLPAPWPDDLDEEQGDVVAEFRLGHSEFSLPAHVSHGRGRTDVLVVFDRPVGNAARLRREIFAQQLRTLRTRDGG